ncbi:hypothetical protein EVAR_33025_1 [Eumeta japonica]|uniref:Uncharacterized protein n=1 Tax=Eumeta variegata TaxID=151549 RepID=A0A4C1VSI5_EUMVA|nr:hypothetical protein EVAR_33025_1 [Eumeta japonica]
MKLHQRRDSGGARGGRVDGVLGPPGRGRRLNISTPPPVDRQTCQLVWRLKAPTDTDPIGIKTSRSRSGGRANTSRLRFSGRPRPIFFWVWRMTNDGIGNSYFKGACVDDLRGLQYARCSFMARMKLYKLIVVEVGYATALSRSASDNSSLTPVFYPEFGLDFSLEPSFGVAPYSVYGHVDSNFSLALDFDFGAVSSFDPSRSRLTILLPVPLVFTIPLVGLDEAGINGGVKLKFSCATHDISMYRQKLGPAVGRRPARRGRPDKYGGRRRRYASDISDEIRRLRRRKTTILMDMGNEMKFSIFISVEIRRTEREMLEKPQATIQVNSVCVDAYVKYHRIRRHRHLCYTNLPVTNTISTNYSQKVESETGVVKIGRHRRRYESDGCVSCVASRVPTECGVVKYGRRISFRLLSEDYPKEILDTRKKLQTKLEEEGKKDNYAFKKTLNKQELIDNRNKRSPIRLVHVRIQYSKLILEELNGKTWEAPIEALAERGRRAAGAHRLGRT